MAAETRYKHRRRDHGVRSAEQVQERNQQQAAGGGAGEIPEIGAVDPLHRFPDGQRDHGSGKEERHGAGEVDQRQSGVTQLARREQNEQQRRDHRRAGAQPQRAQLGVQIAGPRRDDVGEDAAGAQPEQRDRNGQKRKVVIKNDGEDARQRQLQNQRGERGEAEADVKLRPGDVAPDTWIGEELTRDNLLL